ncbi:MAG: Methenyltetrahydrofolate cyclohydrolase [Candidatus Heimdallarchaeota archaeon LC_2]|nr:MAG: Methenyltetrahydrofolate cyclohydrolase [Candidatus Heimdallarchaeota archaeon LC_2]
MDKIVECVPNFSTADAIVIKEISKAIKSVNGVKLLNVEPDGDYNRVVVTFVGTPNKVGEAAFQALAKATELIDMQLHKGEHPRLSACDVTPFIPVKDVSIEDCVQIAKTLAERVASELKVPTYLYGDAATSEDRKLLSNIRKGQYEGLAEKILLPEWKPDFGEVKFVAKSGAYVIGVRDFLIAYNVNLASEDNSVAKEVGELVRESGKLVEKDGKKVRVPGQLKGIQGMGFPLERDGRKLTQVSMNVQDFRNKTKLHEAFELVKKLSEERGVKVTGSEIVGLIPIEAVLEAGKFYLPEETNQEKLIDIVIERMGFSDLEPFIPERKIIELMIDNVNLVDLSLDQFTDDIASNKPTPGGGSVSAAGGAFAASLGAMVANLSIGREKYQKSEFELIEALNSLESIKTRLKGFVDEDTNAFNTLMKAFRISKDDADYRTRKIQNASKYATQVPLDVALDCFEALKYIKIVAEKGNKNAITDAGVAALFAEAAVKGALLNVKINLLSIKDDAFKDLVSSKMEKLEANVEGRKNAILNIVNQELE